MGRHGNIQFTTNATRTENNEYNTTMVWNDGQQEAHKEDDQATVTAWRPVMISATFSFMAIGGQVTLA